MVSEWWWHDEKSCEVDDRNNNSGCSGNIYGSDCDNVDDSSGHCKMMIFVTIIMVAALIK